MSAIETAANDTMMCCASCGISECDDIKLKTCTACKLVRYCSVECQKKHRSKHKRACKKRAAELRDELLFKQPESSYLGDCPICFIPLPLNKGNICMNACCSKMLCLGCVYASRIQGAEQKCPFCRKPCPKDSGEAELMMKKRIEANDPVALREMGNCCWSEGKFSDGFEYIKKASGLGDAAAHHKLSLIYMNGGVEVEDEDEELKKVIYHFEEAAIGGHPTSRVNLGVIEENCGRYDRAMKHFIIAANQGFDAAAEKLKEGYERGYVSKDDFAAALRALQRAIDATKSPQREAAEQNPDSLNLRATNSAP